MPPRRRAAAGRRAGARPGHLSTALTDALRAEEEHLNALPEAQDRAKAVGDFFAALDAELERIALVRIRAVVAMKRGGMSQLAIGRAVGLSKARVGQILRDPRFN